MKQKITLGMLIFLSLNTYGQQVKVRGGVRAGLAFSNSKIDPRDNYPGTAGRTGLLGGGFVNFYLPKNFLLQPAVLFVRKGGRNYDALSVGYLEIPITLLYKMGADKGGIFFGGGLSPAFRTSPESYGYYENFKKFDLGINVSAGYMFPIGFSVNLGYSLGILDVSADETFSMYNRYFGLAAGYEF
jgi:hypothetical protein